MLDRIIDFIYDKFPILFVIAAVVFVVWQVAKFYFVTIRKNVEKVDSHDKCLTDVSGQLNVHEETLKRVGNQLEEHENTLRRVEARLDTHEDTLRRVEARLDSHEDKLTQIINILTKKYPKASDAFAMKNSPRKLSETGERLYQESGAKAVLEECMDSFIGIVEQKNPDNALDVERECYETLVCRTDIKEFRAVKDWVYNSPDWDIETDNGKQRYTIDMNDICFVMSIPLRDEYLKRHPEVLQVNG